MAYRIYFQPSTKMHGVAESYAEYETAALAYKAAYGLTMSDERVRIISPDGHPISYEHLRQLADDEANIGGE